jgi:biotin operon repressor
MAKAESVLKVLEDANEPLTLDDIRSIVGGSRDSIRQLLSAAKEKGYEIKSVKCYQYLGEGRCLRGNAASYTRVNPNPKKYESAAAKQKAYRDRLAAAAEGGGIGVPVVTNHRGGSEKRAISRSLRA